MNRIPIIDHTFTAEYGEPDLILSRSEVAAVRRAADKLGLTLSRTPTGRTVQVILTAALGYATYREAHAKHPYEKAAWHAQVVKTRRAIAQEPYAGVMDAHST